jgi:lipopolysaccharide/colanic/teichoic acid biosynthesis glycosyltransferase
VSSYPPAKRVLDVSISLVLLVVLAPVFVFLFVAMAVEMLRCPRDRGPWLYRETRISRGREFDLLKFRTLRRDILGEMAAELHARMLESDEANLTWAGRRLLKPWYLDELPQLWNVLRGDMSLVGPRPWPRSMVAKQVAEGLTYRNDFIAGWTGPAQVEKGVTESAGYASLDVSYMERCHSASGWNVVRKDLALLTKTVAVMARGEGLRF